MRQLDDLLDCVVGFLVGGFQLTIWLMFGVGTMVEQAVGEWPTEPLMEEQKQECDLESFVREAIGVAATIALQDSVCLHLAQVVAQLAYPVAVGGELETGEDRLVDLQGGPAGKVGSPVQKHFHQADHADVLNLDAGKLGCADLDRERQALQQREVHMHTLACVPH